MSLYFSKLTSRNEKPGNQLAIDLISSAREMERRIIDDSQVQEFNHEFMQKIELCHKHNPGIKPQNLHIMRPYIDQKDTIYQLNNVFTLMLYEVKE